MVNYNIKGIGESEKGALSSLKRNINQANRTLAAGKAGLLDEPKNIEFLIETIVDEQRRFVSPLSFEDAKLKAEKKIGDYKIREFEIIHTYEITSEQKNALLSVGGEEKAKKSPTAARMERKPGYETGLDDYIRM